MLWKLKLKGKMKIIKNKILKQGFRRMRMRKEKLIKWITISLLAKMKYNMKIKLKTQNKMDSKIRQNKRQMKKHYNRGQSLRSRNY